MSLNYAESWPSKHERKCERSELGIEPRRVGQVPNSGRKHESYPVTTGREDCNGTDTTVSRQSGGASTPGKGIDQLVGEVSSQIAYHKTQIGHLEGRLSELRQLSSDLKRNTKKD